MAQVLLTLGDSWPIGGKHLLNVKENQYIQPNFAHPNQLGHQLIADKLASWICLKQ